MTHSVIDFIAPVKPGKVAALEGALDRLGGKTPGRPTGIPFAQISGLHFASFSILGDERAGARLVLECNFDGDLNAYLSILLRKAFAPLHSVYIHCVGCPPDPAALVDYLRAHVVRPAAHHVGNTNRSLEQIRLEAQLRSEIEAFLDGKPAAGASPDDVRAAILAKLGSRPGGIPPIPMIPMGGRVKAWLALAATALVALVLLPFELLGIAVLQILEARDPVHGGVADPNRVRELAKQEDWIVQNHISSAYTVKAGPLRRIALRAVLFAIDRLARTLFTRGKLGSITSIHYAHWALLDGGRTLIFLSNFDGSWRSYLDDFIDKASVGLSAVWSNTLLFPRTWLLVLAGAKDGPRFKAWARDHQARTRVWYSAYPDLTVAQIDKNTKIHEGLTARLEGRAAQDWLDLL